MNGPEDTSPIAAALEFRVLAGSQRGCRLPLVRGRTLAGATERCDLLLDGCAAEAEAFALHVGEDGRAELESLDDALRLRGVRVDGRVALAPGDTFVLGMARFAVDFADAPWPRDAIDGPAPAPAPASFDADDGTPDAFDAGTANAVAAPTGAAVWSAPAPPTRVPTRRRPRAPFWFLWLCGTTVFGCAGVGLIVASLSPAKALPVLARVPALPQSGLAQLVAAANRGQAALALKQDAQGHWALEGSVPTHDRQVALVRAARDADPGLRIDVVADDDMALLAGDTLDRLSMSDELRIARMHAGELVLQGQPSNAAMYEHLVETLKVDVPRLRAVRLEPGVAIAEAVPAAGDTSMRARLQRALADAGLGDDVSVREDGVRFTVSGALTDDDRARWVAVRTSLFALGQPLEIVEHLSTTAAARARPDDVVLAIGGAVPFVLHDDGRKEGRTAAAMP